MLTRKLCELVAVPAGVVTEIGPFLAPVGTVAVICEPPTTEKLAETPPPNVTLAAPVKFVPVIVTAVPTLPDVGENDEIVGADGLLVVTVKTPVLVPVPPGPVTATAPVVAPAGTVVLIELSLVTVNAAAVPLNVTEVAPVKPEPLTVTAVPTGPLAGLKPETAGAAGVDPEQPGSWKDAMRVCQLSSSFVVGWAS